MNSQLSKPVKLPPMPASAKHWEQIGELIEAVFGVDKELIGLELGVNLGNFDRYILNRFPNLKMIGIDFEPTSFSNERFEFIQKTTENALHDVESKKFDFVYVDAGHDLWSVAHDIKKYFPLVKQGGFMAGHDYCDTAWDVKLVVNRYFDGKFETGQDLTWWVNVQV